MYATFDTIPADHAAELVKEVRERVRYERGFVRAHVLLSLDRSTTVIHCRWDRETASPLASWPGAVVTSAGGFETAGISGAEPGAPPGIAAVATRHLTGPEAARNLGELLLRSERWKRRVPGFIGATAYLSADGRTYLNYPQWTDERAYRAYMADPRIAEGQREIARLEAAPPEFVLGRLAADIEAHQGGAVYP